MQARFVDEYLIDLNASKAALRAGYSPKTAEPIGYQLLQKPLVAEAIAAKRERLSVKTEITAEKVLERWWQIATADPNKLAQHRRVNCRHCYGADHAYQWIDESEWELACADANAMAPEDASVLLPSNDGGYGFDATLSPHAKCPKCHGEGHGDIHLADTRNLPADVLPLYAGARMTRSGPEILMHDQAAALEKVSRHIGLFNDKLTLKGEAGNPLALLVQQIQGSAITPKKPTTKTEE